MKSKNRLPATKKVLPQEGDLSILLKGILPINHPKAILRSLAEKKPKFNEGNNNLVENDAVVKALSLDEFQLGTLLNSGFPDYIQTFSTDLSTKLQEEYSCKTTSEKATAHLAAHSYCRILNLQKRINSYLERGEITIIGDKYLEFLSKDLDRAERHYFNAIQTLQMMNQPPIHLTVKTQQANFAQNMVAQQGIV